MQQEYLEYRWQGTMVVWKEGQRACQRSCLHGMQRCVQRPEMSRVWFSQGVRGAEKEFSSEFKKFSSTAILVPVAVETHNTTLGTTYEG